MAPNLVTLPDGATLVGADLEQARTAWSSVTVAHQIEWEGRLGRPLTTDESTAFGDVAGPTWRFYTAADIAR
jgi:hypothetical protein